MNFFRRLSTPVKLIAGSGLLMIIYGYLCRVAGIYFFWESLIIGFDLFLIGLIFFLSGLVKLKRANKRKYILEGIGIGFLCFFLLIRCIFYIVIPNTDAWQAAKTFVSKNDSLNNEVGKITGFGFIPAGSVSVSSSESKGESGTAEINMIVKGEKKFKDLSLYLEAQDGSGWKVTEIH